VATVRIEIKGLRQLQQKLDRKMPRKMQTQLGRMHQKCGELVLRWAKPDMPRRSGKFVGGWKALAKGYGAVVKNSAPHAGVIEFGGAVMWRPTGSNDRGWGRTNPHLIPVRPKPPGDSWHIYPAFLGHEYQIEEYYSKAIADIWNRL